MAQERITGLIHSHDRITEGENCGMIHPTLMLLS
jgi:hypothetical protein